MPARLCIHCPLPPVQRQGNPSSWKSNNPTGSPRRIKEKGSQAPEPPLHLANLVRSRRGRRAIPSREKDPKAIARSESGAEDTVYTLEAEVFARKTRMAKGVMNRSGSSSDTQPERDGGNSSRDQELGRPPIPVHDPSAVAEDRSCQLEGQRGEQSPAEAGQDMLRCLQLRSDQQWEEEIPLEPPRTIPRKNERTSLAGEQSEQGTKRGPQVARTRHPAPHVDEQRRRPSSGRHAL